MKIIIVSFFSMIMLLAVGGAHAGVVIGGTRLIYHENKKEYSLRVSNKDKAPYLIQSWIEDDNGQKDVAPFLITPPLFRLSAEQNNIIRIVRVGGSLPLNKESLFWITIKVIPSKQRGMDENTLQIAVKTRIKLIYRPTNLKGSPEDIANKLQWKREGNSIHVTNPTPFYINFYEVKLSGKYVNDATYISPMSTAIFTLPNGVKSSNVTWRIINDYGSTGKEYEAAL